MKEKTILKELKNRGWNMQFDAREKHLIKEIAEITEAKRVGKAKLESKQCVVNTAKQSSSQNTSYKNSA